MKQSEHLLSKQELLTSFQDLCKLGSNLLASKKYEDVTKSLHCFLDALQISEKLYSNQNHPETARVLYSIGYAYQQLGGTDNCVKALDFHEKALKMRQAYYGDIANAEIAGSLNMINITYRALGGNINKLKSLEFANKALEMRQKLYAGKAHLSIMESLSNVASAHDSLGGDENLSKSLALLEQALDMSRSLHSNQPNIDTAKILNSIGIHYQRLGGIDNLNKALVNLQESLDIRQKLNSNINPDVAVALNNIGILYQRLSLIDLENRQKHLESNLDCMKKAVEINQEFYGNHPHPALARSIQDLSIVYIHLGGDANMKQAYQLQTQALQMCQKLYSADHPRVMECLNNLNYIVQNCKLDLNDNNDDQGLIKHETETQSLNTQSQVADAASSYDVETAKEGTTLMGNINNE